MIYQGRVMNDLFFFSYQHPLLSLTGSLLSIILESQPLLIRVSRGNPPTSSIGDLTCRRVINCISDEEGVLMLGWMYFGEEIKLITLLSLLPFLLTI